MENNIANISEMSNEQIMKAIGQDDGSSKGINIPRLGINRSPEDDDGNEKKEKEIGESAMQYMHYDPDKSEYVNRSIIIKSWKEEAVDILGGVKCGKVPFKDRESLTPEQLAEQRTIRCYRLLYGLLSFKGVKANGEEHTVSNLPALWRVTGTAFSPVGTALDQITKRKKLMFTTTLSVDTKRQKKGGNVYYTPEISVNAEAGLEMSKEDMETLGVFQEVINKENTEVVDLYKAAKKSTYEVSDKDMKKVVDQVEDPIDVLAK
jgi:hypothetical protein